MLRNVNAKAIGVTFIRVRKKVLVGDSGSLVYALVNAIAMPTISADAVLSRTPKPIGLISVTLVFGRSEVSIADPLGSFC